MESQTHTAELLGYRFAEDEKPSDTIRVRHNGVWHEFPADAVNPKKLKEETAQEAKSTVAHVPEGITFAQLESQSKYRSIVRPNGRQIRSETSGAKNGHMHSLDVTQLEEGMKALEKMRTFMGQACKEPSARMNSSDYQAKFGPHLFHAANCIADCKKLIDRLILDGTDYEFIVRIITYALHITAEYMTLKNDACDWDKIPLHSAHEHHDAYITSLVNEAIESAKKIRCRSDDELAKIVYDLLLGKNYSAKTNKAMGSHLRSMITADTTMMGSEDYPVVTDGMSVNDFIDKYGSDEGYEPSEFGKVAEPTNAPAGSDEKIEILRERESLGLPLWHEYDRTDYTGLTGGIKVRQ